MALTDASRLANFAAGIGTPGSAINVDNVADTVGVGTNTVLAGATLQVGTGVTIYGNSGIVSAVTFRGSFIGSGEGLTGVASTDNILSNAITVSGVSTFSDNVSIGDSIFHTGDTNTAIRFPAADTFTVETAGSERLRADSSGNIGIGTDTPTGRVQIDTTSGGRALTVNAPTNGTYITFETANTAYADIGSEAGTVGSGTNDLLVLNARSTRDLAFRTNSAERLRINSSGNVGIGTDNPTAELEVQGATTPEVMVRNTTTSSFSSFHLAEVGDSSGTFVVNRLGSTSTATGGARAGQIWNSANAPIVFATNNSERMRILAAGGLTFNGDTAAANALDDYEEGTWTPGYSFGGTAHTSIISAGTYIKTGGMVFVTGYLYTNNSSTYSGTATITGLPFSIPSGMRYRGAFAIGQIRRFNEDMPNIKLYAGDNGTVISMLRQSTNSNGATELTNAQFNFQSEYNIISFSGSYPVA
jgi:hypothetical protein